MQGSQQRGGRLCSPGWWGIRLLLLSISCPFLIISQVNSQSAECPPSEIIPGCPCYNFEDGLFLECAGATEETISSTLQGVINTAGKTHENIFPTPLINQDYPPFQGRELYSNH